MTAVRTRSWIWTAAAAVVAYLVFDLLTFLMEQRGRGVKADRTQLRGRAVPEESE